MALWPEPERLDWAFEEPVPSHFFEEPVPSHFSSFSITPTASIAKASSGEKGACPFLALFLALSALGPP